MEVEICKWFGDALAPVIFMVDDFCNVWVDGNGNGSVDLGEDWGYAQRREGSSLVFLEETVLKDFPEVKITFFVPVGERSPVIENPGMPFVAKAINCDQKTKEFFRSIGEDLRYELAYHGTNHGQPGLKAKDFRHEWETFASLDQALQTIALGKEIYHDVLGVFPRGGKYCGYLSNEFSDESIDLSGFSWWCRYSNVALTEGNESIGGEDYDPLTNFDVKYFGRNGVLDIPTTLNGSLLSSVFHPENNLKGLLKRILKPLLIKLKLKKVDFLLENRLVVGIQEHIAPARVDGLRQMPNIFDDQDSLRRIFRHLKKKNLWYCTCTELADYVLARDSINIRLCSNNRFSIHPKSSHSGNPSLTLRIRSDKRDLVQQPDGSEVRIEDQLVNIKIMSGFYTVI